MNPYQAYQNGAAKGQLRIDVVVSLYEEAIERLEKTLAAAQRQDAVAVEKLMPPIHLIVGALAGAIDDRAGEMSLNLLRLFDFVIHCLKTPNAMHLQPALNVMRTLHEAFVTIRDEAAQLERAGQISSLDRLHAVEVSA
jgi:flagellin-specific chaperone FliS